MSEEMSHPGSWVGDTTNEFKKLPKWGKFLAVGAIILVAVVAFYEYRKSQGTSGTGFSASGSTGAATSGGGASGIQSPFAQVPTTAGQGATVPVIPFGDTPLFDGLGNLIGWQQPGPATPTQPPTTTPPPPTANPFTWPAALAGMKIWEGTSSHKFFYGPKGPQHGGTGQTLLSTLFPAGTTFSSPTGKAGGELDYTLPGATTPAVASMKLVNPLPPPAVHKGPQHSAPPAPRKVVKK